MNPKPFFAHLVVIVVFLMSIISCTNNSKATKKADTVAIVKIDTSKSIKIDNSWITPKPALGYAFGNNPTISADTIDLPGCSNYVFYPFGKIKDHSELSNSLLKNFSVIDKTDTSNGDKTIVQSLKLDSSKLLLFFDHDPEAERGSYVIKGEIYDKTVIFANNIRIGMDQRDFYKLFFVNYPEELQDKYHIIAFDTCVDGLRHIYTFQDHRLRSVKFECIRCTWTVGY